MRIPVAFLGRVALVSAFAVAVGCSSVIVLNLNEQGSSGGPFDAGKGGAGGQGAGGQGAGGGQPDPCMGLDLSTGLVAYYPFEGDAKDMTGHGHDGALSAGPSGNLTFAAGKYGKALLFSGIEARVIVPDAVALQTADEFSLAVWVNPTSYPQNDVDFPAIIAKGGYDYLLNVQIGDKEGLAAFSVANFAPSGTLSDGVSSPADAMVPRKIPVGEWTQVTATFKLGYLRLFIGGEKVDEKQSVVDHVSPKPMLADDLFIGNVYTDLNHNYTLQGSIDDVRIYDRALTPQEAVCLASALPE